MTFERPTAWKHSFENTFRTLRGLLVLGRPRTWFFTYFAFLAGVYLGPVSVPVGTMTVALGIFGLGTAATNQLNVYTDRDEDSHNLPDRVSLVETVGPRTLRNTAVLIYVVDTVVAASIDPVFGVVVFLAAFVSYSYSMPPLRFKARPFGSLLFFSGAFGFPLAGGYLLAAPDVTVPPIVWLMTYWFGTYGVVKNLPDYDGDKAAGLRTPATIFDTKRDATIFAGVVLTTPFPLIAAGALGDLIALKNLLLLAFLPVVLLIIRAWFRSDSDEELEVAHTGGFFYAMGMAAVFLLLQNQSLGALGLAIIPFGLLVTIEKVGFDSR